MSEIVVLGLKVGFLALLWVFVLFAGGIIRADMFGRSVPVSSLAEAAASLKKPRRQRTVKMPSHLKITKGKQAGLRLPLGEELRIGRSSDCQLILDDDYVSTRHAALLRTPTGYVVEDLGSTNGTYLNNERVTGRTPITPSDTLRIGRTLMSVEK